MVAVSGRTSRDTGTDIRSMDANGMDASARRPRGIDGGLTDDADGALVHRMDADWAADWGA